QITPTVNVTSLGSLTISGVLSGAFGLNQTGGGKLTLSAVNTFTGDLSVGAGGTLSITNDSSLGAGTGATALTLNGGSTFLVNSGTTINANRGIRLVGPTASSISIPSINNSAGTTVTYNGSITDGGTTGSLTKVGFGTLVLGGQSSYTGATTV